MKKFYLVVSIKNFTYIQKKLLRMGYRYSYIYANCTKDNGTLDILWRDPEKFAIIIEGNLIVDLTGTNSPKLKDLKEVSIEDLILVEI